MKVAETDVGVVLQTKEEQKGKKWVKRGYNGHTLITVNWMGLDKAG